MQPEMKTDVEALDHQPEGEVESSAADERKKRSSKTMPIKKNLYTASSPLSKERHQNVVFACGAQLC